MSELKGLGDSIERFTRKTGLKSLTEIAMGDKDCGCEKRRQWLNSRFPYKNK